MRTFSTLLVAIDGSSADANLLDFAADRVRNHPPSRIVLAHAVNHAAAAAALAPGYVSDPTPILHALDEESNAIIASAKKHLSDAGVTSIATAQPEGSGNFAIADYVRNHPVDAIVIGTHGRTGLARFALGSIADSVLRSANRPTFTLRTIDDAPRSMSGALKRILVAVDDEEPSDRGFALALKFAADEGAEIRLCHVIDKREARREVEQRSNSADTTSIPAFTTSLEHFFDALVAKVRDKGIPVTCTVPEGTAVDCILREAANWNADAIVLGTHGRRGLQRLILGSVAAAVICQATVPVLAVPPPDPTSTP
jgi:nucleotide-binding universal stress UspA family protein